MNNLFLESRFIKLYDRHFCYFMDFIDRNVISALHTVDSVLYSFGPFALMFITNFSIVFKFMRAKCKQNSTESTNQALSKSATRGTAMVITVSVTFIILTAPTAVDMVLWLGNRLSNSLVYDLVKTFVHYLNHSINGILYCIVGSRFRNELLKLICGKKRPDDISVSHSVNTDVSVSGSRI